MTEGFKSIILPFWIGCKVRSRGICVSATAKYVKSLKSYFFFFSKFLYECYLISIIMIVFAKIFKKIRIFSWFIALAFFKILEKISFVT